MQAKLDLEAYVLLVAAKSPCGNRQVGCVIADIYGNVLGEGYNASSDPSLPCEDAAGATESHVVHAEVAAIDSVNNKSNAEVLYVTHPPCQSCLGYIKGRLPASIQIVVVESFMKFDTGKLRYDLIPPSAMKALAEVLTYGAKKYKPNNWKEVDDTDRYIAAAMRHFEAWRGGEATDSESGMHHLKHVITNIAFLLEFENED